MSGEDGRRTGWEADPLRRGMLAPSREVQRGAGRSLPPGSAVMLPLVGRCEVVVERPVGDARPSRGPDLVRGAEVDAREDAGIDCIVLHVTCDVVVPRDSCGRGREVQ